MPSRSARPQRASHSTCRRPRAVPRSLQKAGSAGQCSPGVEGRVCGVKAPCRAMPRATSHIRLSGAGAGVTVACGGLQAEEGAPSFPPGLGQNVHPNPTLEGLGLARGAALVPDSCSAGGLDSSFPHGVSQGVLRDGLSQLSSLVSSSFKNVGWVGNSWLVPSLHWAV